jgi:signal transduction histidine kinase
MTSAGAGVTLTMTGRQRPLPGSVELCGYRIVQEALTNAGRHAPGSHAWVELNWRDHAVHISVRDDGRRLAAAAHVPAAAQVPGAPAAGAGFGLLGLRERVAMLGGQFEAGPGEAAGFCVSALLPAAPDGGGQPA